LLRNFGEQIRNSFFVFGMREQAGKKVKKILPLNERLCAILIV